MNLQIKFRKKTNFADSGFDRLNCAKFQNKKFVEFWAEIFSIKSLNQNKIKITKINAIKKKKSNKNHKKYRKKKHIIKKYRIQINNTILKKEKTGKIFLKIPRRKK